MTQQIKFIQEEIFHREEGKYVEFKKVESQKPVNKIVDHAEEYIIGFLNASVKGDIYLGINDSGEIKGITLSRSDRDKIQKNITDKLTNIDPVIPLSCYSVDIHFVHDAEYKQIEDLCIVQIQVSQIEEDYLYKTSEGIHWLYETEGGSNYLKKASSCIKLNNQQIEKEIKYRHQKHLRKELETIDNQLFKSPNNIQLLIKKAEIAKFMNDIELIDETYKKLILLKPNSSKTRVAYASAHKSIGDLECALSVLNDAVEFNKNNSDILKARGEILFISKRTDEALKSYQDALQLNPNDYTILTQIGITFRELGKYKESIEFFNYALLKSLSYRAAKYEKKKTYYKMFQGGIVINITS
ncbi:RNA-binding domain-containing protein [Nostoc sp.]|uniref:RNA-binding domain-containing protein n=1 Tax=Nostoc sp. TaxID=1180 RepID=UPI002FF6835C